MKRARLFSIINAVTRRLFPSIQGASGNAMIAVVGVMGAASIAGIVSFYDYFKVISTQKASMQYQTQINLALASSLDYIIWLVKQRACVGENLTRGLCENTIDSGNTERLLFLPPTAEEIAKSLGEGKTFKDVLVSKIERTVTLSSINEMHPLYPILLPLRGKGVVDHLYVKMERDDAVQRKGREVYVRFTVGLRQRASQSLGPALEAEALIAFFPRELANFSLVTSGNLIFGATPAEIPQEYKTLSDSSFIAVKKSEATGAGLVFQSPVFVNKNIFLGAKGASGDQSSNDFVNITFGDSVSLGDGVIFQKSSQGSGYNPYKPLNAGGDDSTYNYQNTGVFGGFLRGLKLEMKDAGLDCLFNDPASCTVNTELMRQCIQRTQMFADLSATKDVYLVVKRASNPQESGSGKEIEQSFFYDVGVNSPDEIIPLDGLTAQRNPGASQNCGGLAGASSPCWNSEGTGTFSGDPVLSTSSVVLSSTDSNAPIASQKPISNISIKFPFFKSTVIVAADLGSSSLLKFELAYPSGASGPLQAKTDLFDLINTQNQSLYHYNGQILCMNSSVSPYPSPAPSPPPAPALCLLSPYNCNGGLTSCDGKNIAEVTTARDDLLAIKNSNQSGYEALDSLGDVDGKKIQFEISSERNKKTPGKFKLNIKIKNAGYLPVAPIVELQVYDAGVAPSTGIDWREANSGPNKRDAKYRVLAFARDTSGSDPKLKEQPPQGSYSNGTWKLLSGENLIAGTSPPNEVEPTGEQQTLAEQCRKEQAVAIGGGDWDRDFTKSTTTSWHFAPKDSVPGVMPNLNTPNHKNYMLINSSTQSYFHVGSIIDKCVIDASVKTVMGFLICGELYIDYAYSEDNGTGEIQVSSSSYQTRTVPLEMIGTFIVGRLKIAPETLRKGSITWRSIYHPASLATLRDTGNIWGTLKRPDACTVSHNLPVWAPLPPPERMNELYRCSAAFLRDRVNPIQWTTVTPDCGLAEGESETACVAPFRSKNFMTLDLFRRVGGAVMYDQIKDLTENAKTIAEEKKAASGGGSP